MQTPTHIELYTPNYRQRLATLPGTAFNRLEYALVENDEGALTLIIPPIVPFDYFKQDGIIEVWRSWVGGAPYLEGNTAFLIDEAYYEDRGATGIQIIVKAHSANTILARRHNLYYAGSAQTKITADPIDDGMKQIVRDNFLSITSRLNERPGTIYDANAEGPIGYMTVAADAGLLPTTSRSFSWRNVLDLLKELAAESTTRGTYAAFAMVRNDTADGFEFRTYANHSGTDRRAGGPNPLIVSPEFNTVKDARIVRNWRESFNLVCVGGSGEADDRIIGFSVATPGTPAYDSLFAGPFSRREKFAEADAFEGAEADAIADSILSQSLARVRFEGVIQQTADVQYGRDYAIGTLLTAQMLGISFDCRVMSVRVVVDQQNGEQVTANISQDMTL